MTTNAQARASAEAEQQRRNELEQQRIEEQKAIRRGEDPHRTGQIAGTAVLASVSPTVAIVGGVAGQQNSPSSGPGVK